MLQLLLCTTWSLSLWNVLSINRNCEVNISSPLRLSPGLSAAAAKPGRGWRTKSTASVPHTHTARRSPPTETSDVWFVTALRFHRERKGLVTTCVIHGGTFCWAAFLFPSWQPAIISACSEKSIRAARRAFKSIKSLRTDFSREGKWRFATYAVMTTLMAPEQKEHPFKCHENAHDLLWNIFFSNYPQELGRVNCRGLELVGVKWRKNLIKRVALDPPPSFVPLTGVFPHEFVFKSSRRGREPVTENREFFYQPFFARHHLPLRENIISFCAWSSAFVLLLLPRSSFFLWINPTEFL